MLVSSIFSFSQNVSKNLLQGRLRSGLCGKELMLYLVYVLYFLAPNYLKENNYM